LLSRHDDVYVRADAHQNILLCKHARLGFAGRSLLQMRQTLLQIERRSHTLHGQAELHHGKRYLRLYADDYRIRAA
jgi:hypothetical protein